MRYLIIPKYDEVEESLSRLDDKLDSQSRAKCYGELSRLRCAVEFSERNVSARKQWRMAARDVAGGNHDVRTIASPEAQTVASGVTIVETTPEGAAAIEAEFPGVSVVPDDDLELIKPEVGPDIAAEPGELTDAELWHLEAIGLKAARANGFTGTGAGVTVAVLDTGIAEVPEIHGKITRTLTLDTDAWKTVPQDAKDTDGHGTHVAGLIAGNTVGVAPGAKLASVIMIPNGVGRLSDYVLALEWVASQPQIAVLNMSAGKPDFHENMRIMARVMRRVRTLACIAIGNEGPDTSRSPGNYPEVISVGASNANKKIWLKSGGGSIPIDGTTFTCPKLVAPGEGITSSVMYGGYQSWNGTSMATPILSGIACLILERFPKITLKDLESELLQSCEDLKLDEKRQGKGQVRLPASLTGPTS